MTWISLDLCDCGSGAAKNIVAEWWPGNAFPASLLKSHWVIVWKVELCAFCNICFIQVQVFCQHFQMLTQLSNRGSGKCPTWARSCVDSDFCLLVEILVEILDTTKSFYMVLCWYILAYSSNVGLFPSASRPCFFQTSLSSVVLNRRCATVPGRTASAMRWQPRCTPFEMERGSNRLFPLPKERAWPCLGKAELMSKLVLVCLL